jgi:hypothetical protein
MSVRTKSSRSGLLPVPPEIELDTSPPSPLHSSTNLAPPDELDLNNPRWSTPRYPEEGDGISSSEDEASDDDEGPSEEEEARIIRKERGERWFALFVACLLSVGSH